MHRDKNKVRLNYERKTETREEKIKTETRMIKKNEARNERKAEEGK